jgi:hypothetical protein
MQNTNPDRESYSLSSLLTYTVDKQLPLVSTRRGIEELEKLPSDKPGSKYLTSSDCRRTEFSKSDFLVIVAPNFL